MELNTNGQAKGKGKKKAGSLAKQVRSQAAHLVGEGEHRVSKAVTEATSFARRRPKTTIALALGAGIMIGALANGRFGRAAFVGLVDLIADRFA